MGNVSKEILKLVKANKMDFETAFNALAKDGVCPNLINDDFGYWSVQFDGYQEIPKTPGKPDNIQSSFYIKKSHWKKTIKAALINALQRK